MKISNDFTNTLHLVLKDLIEEKSRRDQVRFTSSQLASALGMPRSMITKLTHPDESKRVVNPRVDTLLKIVEFFRADGFNITIDDLLGTTKQIEVMDQKEPIPRTIKKIPVYSFDSELNKKLGMIEIKVANTAKDILALHANEDIKPFFKKGSIFIIDRNLNPEDDTLVAVKIKTSNKIEIRKFHINKYHSKTLKSLDLDESKNIVMPSLYCEYLGVVIQINAET